MSRIVYDTANKLKTTEFDVFRLAFKYEVGALQMDDLNRRYGYYMRGRKEPAWLIDFCLDVLSGKTTISQKELRPEIRFDPRHLKGGLD